MAQKVNVLPNARVVLCHKQRVKLLPIAAFLAMAAGCAASSLPVLQLTVSNETAPPGGTVQLKFFASKPSLIGSGDLVIDLDPAVFAAASAATAFSANGDAYGLAKIDGLHVEMHFGSPSLGLGQLPNLPIAVVMAAVKPGAATGQTASVTADLTSSNWSDPQGTFYSVSIRPGTVTVGGSLSIASVTPVGGVLPGGTMIQITGTGFNPSATAQIDGASIASVQPVDSQTISLTLAGPAELTGKRVRVVNPDGSQVEAFAFPPAVPVSYPGAALDGVLPIYPLQTYTAATLAGFGPLRLDGTAIRNPNAVDAQLLFDTTGPIGDFVSEQALTIPAGGSVFELLTGSRGGRILLLASAPVQIAQLTELIRISDPSMSTYQLYAPALGGGSIQPLQVVQNPSQSIGVSWVWQVGAAPPEAQSLSFGLPQGQPPTDLTISVATSSGGPWLSATPSGPIHCQTSSCVTLQASVNPGSLSPGVYRGTVTITPIATPLRSAVVPVVIPVALTVIAAPLSQTIIATRFFHPNNASDSVLPPPGMFAGAVSVSIFTDSGGNWLSASPDKQTAPTSIAVSANTAGLGVGSYSGEVIVTGSGNTLVIPVQVLVEGSVRLVATDAGTGGSLGSANFAAQAGAAPPPPQLVPVTTEDCVATECFNVNPNLSSLAAAVQTHLGANWLSASVSSQGVLVSANPAGLNAGVYVGAVTLTANGIASGQFPVVLVVENSPPPALVASTGLFSIQFQGGRTVSPGLSPVCLSSSSVPLSFNVRVSTSDGGGWIRPVVDHGTTPECVRFAVDGTALAPGNYTGSIGIDSGQQSISIPVMAVQASNVPPLLGSVVSAASEIHGAISPGEILAIHGLSLGPLTPAGPSVDPLGQFSKVVAGVTVTMGGIAAPVLYASSTQVNVVVPYEVAGNNNATVQVHNSGVSTMAWTIPLAASAPGVFTLDSTGIGAAAVLNADNSINTPANPAARGSNIQLFATGEGVTSPPGKTGGSAAGNHPPVLPVQVTIGGAAAAIVYHGSAPGEIQGLFQVNAVVPAGITPGDAVPVVLTVGQAQSPAGATISIK